MPRTLDGLRQNVLRDQSARSRSSKDPFTPASWTTTILTGLGLGAGAGCVEVVIIALREGRPVGTFPLLALAIWAAVGGMAALIGRIGVEVTADSLASRASVALRALIGLALFAAPVWVPLDLRGGTRWRIVVTGGIVALLAIAAWLTSPALSRRRALQRPLVTLSRAAPALFVLAFAVGAALAVRRTEPGIIVPLPQAPPTDRMTPIGSSSTRLFLIGLDAASWGIVQPLLDSGELPNLRRLMERGWWGVLRSTDPSFSPVVWTSIVSGQPPEIHGVHTSAAELRVKTLWDIAGEAGLRATVVNVPGTYPARVNGTVSLFSGFPLPSRASLTSLGWIITAGPVSSYPIAPVHVQLPAALTDVTTGEHVEAAVDLVDLPAGSRLVDSVPISWLRSLGLDDLAHALARHFGGRVFGRIELTVEPGDDGVRVTGRGDEPLFNLVPGEWSDWLRLEWEEHHAWFRVHFTTASPQPTLYVTPLFRMPEESVSGSAVQLPALVSRPHVPEGAGWLLAFDDRLIASLRDHLLDTADGLTETALEALDQSDPDLFAYVMTVTDRIQHGFMKFAFPDPYWQLARERGGDYKRYQPTPEQAVRFEDAIAAAYRHSDLALGRILDRAAPKSWVLLVSDHGAAAGPRTTRPTGGAHDPEGIYVLAQAGGQPDGNAYLVLGEQGPELELEDITPIALHLLGLPVARDMAGRVPAMLRAATGTVEEISSYEGDNSVPRSTVENEDDLREQLRSLGYLE